MSIDLTTKVLGVIPARGGSKGLPRKNIRIIADEPLISYTIKAAANSHLLTKFVVSTEDLEIENVARSLGSEVIQRPKELAADDIPWFPVVQHSLSVVDPENIRFDYVMILQCPTPLRTSEDIDAAIALIVETGADTIVSVYQVQDQHPMRMYYLEKGQLVPYAKEPKNRRRQVLPPVYHRNGAIYVFKRSLLDQYGTHLGPDLRPYIMPRERSVNIHDDLDVAAAEGMLKKYGKNK